MKKYVSVVDYLNDNKVDASFENRKSLAKLAGIDNYNRF